MKKLALALAMSLVALGWIASEEAIAGIEFIDGTVTITRAGAPLKAVSIGDDLQDEDYISTGANGRVTLALSASLTGMSGTIKVAPRSSFYLRVDELKGERQTEAELIAGQISLKVKKASGSPSLSVSTGNTVMGVRGTEFEVTTSPEGSVLVDCSEGEVSCSDESGQSSALPGQAVEKREGVKLRRLAVSLADSASFRQKWIDGEEESFRKNAPKAAKAIAARYLELAERLVSLHAELSSSGVLKQWSEDARKGSVARTAPQDLDRQLAATGSRLLEAKKILGTMERIGARVEALELALADQSAVLAQELRKGFTVADFFKRFEAEKERNIQRVAWLRFAGKLYKEHDAERRRGGAKGR